MIRTIHVNALFLAATAAFAACAGGTSSIPGVTRSSDLTRIALTMPQGAVRRAVATVDGRQYVIDVSPSSRSCDRESDGRTCFVQLPLTRGTHVVGVDAHDGRGRSLGESMREVRVDAHWSHGIAFVAGGVPAYVTLDPSPVIFSIASPTRVLLYVSEQTRKGQTILGPTFLPVTLTAYQQPGNAVTLKATQRKSKPGTTIKIVKPSGGQPVKVLLENPTTTTPVSLVATTTGTASATAMVVIEPTATPEPSTTPPPCTPMPAATGIYIPFTDTPATAYSALFQVPVSVPGTKASSSFTVALDTGSVGLNLSKSAFIQLLGGSGSNYPNPLPSGVIGPGAPGEETYTSDHLNFYGYWWTLPMTFGTGSASVTTIPMQAFVWYKCTHFGAPCSSARAHSNASSSSSNLGNMGIGFADATNGFGPIDNPFMQLQPMITGSPTSIPRRYIINNQGITFGGTAAQLAGFTWIKLPLNNQIAGDWNLASGCVEFPQAPNASSTYACGAFKVDTGYPPMILSLPPNQGPAGLKAYLNTRGNTIEVFAPGNVTSGSSAPVLNWTFDTPGIGAGKPPFPPTYPAAIPNGIDFSPTNSYTYINTGQHIIYQYDYAYDADCGAIGFRPASPSPPPMYR
jgi:hypothetical protein